MAKVVRAHGPPGRQDDQWNWCGSEVVGTHGVVCANACRCGFARSFTGIDSAKGASRAVVDRVSESELMALRKRLVARVTTEWGRKMAADAARAFDRLSHDLLAPFPPGDVVEVHLTESDATLRSSALAH